MNTTLPLFVNLDPEPGGHPARVPGAPVADNNKTRVAGASVATSPAVRNPAATAGVRSSGSNPHLRAAWRLSRSMWRYRDHSPEETRAGLAICHHLRALLADHPEDRSS